MSTPKYSKNLIGGIFLNFLLFFSVIAIKTLDIDNSGMHSSGAIVLIANICRLLLGLILGIAFITLGNIALGQKRKSQLSTEEEIGFVDFFTGSSIYGLLFSMLGLFSLLKIEVSFLAVVPVLFFATSRIDKLNRLIANQKFLTYLKSKNLNCYCFLLCGAIALFSFFFRIFINGLYPLAGDGDVWIHYLQYLRSVLDTGDSLPGSNWYHFYLSKGAGLNFLAGLMSDSLAAQIISSLFFLISGFILFELLSISSINASWAFTGITIYCLLFDGVFFKNHVVLTAYIAFLILLPIKTCSCNQNQYRRYSIASYIIGSYLGFCQPIQSIPILIYLTIAIGFFSLLENHEKVRKILFKIILAICISMTLVFALNYLLTGLIEHVPLSITWRLVNDSIFSRTYGYSGPLFFLSEQSPSTITSLLKPNISWIVDVFRIRPLLHSLPTLLWIFLSIAILLQLIRPIAWNRIFKYRNLLIIIFSLSIASVLLAQAQQVGSVYRLLSYLSLVTAIVFILLCNVAFLPLFNNFLKSKNYYIPMLCSFYFLYIFFTSIPQERLGIIYNAISGRSSLYTTLKNEDIEPVRMGQLDLFIEFRNRLGSKEKIWALAQVVDPSMAFPYPGILSEPSNDFGPLQRAILTESGEKSERLLKDLGINYFYLPTGENARALYSSLAFSNLFKPEEMQKRFSALLVGDSGVILTWKTKEQSEVPIKSVQMLDLFRSGALYSAYQANYLQTTNPDLLLNSNESLIDSIGQSLKSVFTSKIPENNVLFEKIIISFKFNLRNLLTIESSDTRNSKERKENYAELIHLAINKAISENVRLEFGDDADSLYTYNARFPYRDIVLSLDKVGK